MIEATEACVDADGVVAALLPKLCEIHGLDYSKWPPGVYELSDAFGISLKEVWEHPRVQTEEFWSELPLLPWAKELMAMIDAKFKRENVCFLTKPVRDERSASGKYKWFKRHFPRHKFLIGTAKKFNAGPTRLLLDDSEANEKEFRDGGGMTILFPAVANRLHKHADDPLPIVRAMLEDIRVV